MALGYAVEADGPNDAFALVREGPSPRRRAELMAGLGLAGLLVAVALTPVFADAENDAGAVPFALLILSGLLLTIGAFGLGWARARGFRLIVQPRRIEIQLGPGQAYLQIGRRSISVDELVRVEIHQVPVSGESRIEYQYVIGMVLRSQVIELMFDDFERARSVVLELVARLGVGEPVVRARPLFRAYGAALLLPIMAGICAPMVAGIWPLVFVWGGWETALLQLGAVLGVNVGVFLLTWLLGRPATTSYLATEYAMDH